MSEEILKIVSGLLDLILTFVPHQTAAQLLDEREVERARKLADLAEVEKFGSSIPPKG